MVVPIHVSCCCTYGPASIESQLTSPRRTAEDNGFLGQRFQLRLENLENVAFDPPDLVRDAIDLRVMFGARQRLRILFDGENLLPASGQGKRDGVPARARESVNEHRFGLGRRRDVSRDSSVIICILALCTRMNTLTFFPPKTNRADVIACSGRR